MTKFTKVLYEMQKNTSDQVYEGFALRKTSSILGRDELYDDLMPGFEDGDSNPRWTQPLFADIWVPPDLVGNVASSNDYPCANLILPIFSERARDVLADYLEPNGELLPVNTEVGKYFFYNVTKISDALDHKNSRCEFWCSPPTTTDSIDFFSFKKGKLDGLSIFRLYEWPMSVIVTDQFLKCVQDNNLAGFEFKKLWPYNIGVDWEMEPSIITG